MPVLSTRTGARCECFEGKCEILGKCQNLFTKNGCLGEKILLPDNLDLKFDGNYLCPPWFSCKSSTTCTGFSKSLEKIKSTVDSKSKLEKSMFLESLVCNKTTRSICCPDFEHTSFLSPSVLVASLRSATAASCVANPCPGGSWPWVGEDGLARCVTADEDVKDCETKMELFDGELKCAVEEFDVRIIAGKENCGRRRRWKYGRCVRIF